jgi:outer membrane protein
MRRLTLVCCLSFAAIAQTPDVQVGVKLTLDEARERALRNSPNIEVARLQAAAAAQGPLQARSALSPLLSASLTGAGASNDSRLGAGALNNPVIYSRLGTGISVSQLLWDFGRTNKLIATGEMRSEAADTAIQATRSSALLGVTQAYYAGLRADALIRVASQTLEARRVVLDQVKALAEASIKSGLDVSFAEVNVAEAELLLQKARNDRQAAAAQLAAWMGEEQTRSYVLVENAEPAGELGNPADLISEAMRRRPELIARRQQAQADRLFAQAEDRLRWPSLSIVGSAGYMPFHVGAIQQSGYAAAGLNIGLPLLNGGAFRARQAEADFRAKATSQQVRQLEIEIKRDVNVAFLNASMASERVGLAQKLADQSSKAFDLAKARYELGLSSIVEVS